LDRIPEKSGEAKVGIPIIGDFNDEPFNRSLTQYTLGTNCKQKVLNAKTPVVFNPMYPFLGKGIGSHYFNSTPSILDQFLVSETILNEKSGFKLNKDAAGNYLVNIEMFPEMTAQGDYRKPIRFGRPSSALDQNGLVTIFLFR
jgi:hypothetical protein